MGGLIYLIYIKNQESCSSIFGLYVIVASQCVIVVVLLKKNNTLSLLRKY